jgi:hypothetical protein
MSLTPFLFMRPLQNPRNDSSATAGTILMLSIFPIPYQLKAVAYTDLKMSALSFDELECVRSMAPQDEETLLRKLSTRVIETQQK